uniref:Venom protein n=1 Tax=Caenorhabditis tropicalis TaxID=1561998 RepID=A0A1I7T7J5_9PELO
MRFFLLFFIAFTVLLHFATAEIYCNSDGRCTGDGGPSEDVRCGNCHSCTYKSCCHVRFTNPYTKCHIDGWRSDAYRTING